MKKSPLINLHLNYNKKLPIKIHNKQLIIYSLTRKMKKLKIIIRKIPKKK